MNEITLWPIKRITGLILLLGFVLALPGLIMFWIRGGVTGDVPPFPVYFVWERLLILSGVVSTAVGFVVMVGIFKNPNAAFLAKIGAGTFLLGALLVATAEALSLTLGYEKVIFLLDVYVVLACLSQTFTGIALLMSEMLAPWIGWTTVLINISGLTLILTFSRQDMYFPILHHLAPIIIGISLLTTKT